MRISRSVLCGAILAIVITMTACGDGQPGSDGLKESFAGQLGANKFVQEFSRSGDEMTFTGPGAEGGTAKWRVTIDSAVIEPNTGKDAEAHPFKGTVKSSWFSDGQPVKPAGARSNLPIELMSNGLSQDCWAFWDKTAKRWGWE